jgi:hypothetical protein
MKKKITSITGEIGSGSDASKFYIDKVYLTNTDSIKRYTRAFYLLIVVLVTHWLLHIGALTEVSIFSVKLHNTSTVYWALSFIQAFLFYQVMSAIMLERYCQNFIHFFCLKQLPSIYNKN